jgi:hypothetical protein
MSSTSRDADAVIADLRQWLRSDADRTELCRADAELLVAGFQTLAQSAQRLRRQNRKVRLKYERLRGGEDDVGEDDAAPSHP